MKKISLTLLVGIIALCVDAQTIDNFSLAHKLYEQGEMELYEEYLEKAGYEDNIDAIYEMARYRENCQNYTAALSWYEVAAKRGHREAIKSLVKVYSYGNAFKDSTKAQYWLTELSKERNTDLLLFLGDLNVTLSNYSKAIEYYTEALEAGEAKGAFGLSVIYISNNKAKDVSNEFADEGKALEMCRKAAEMGNAEAQYNLYVYYNKGCIVQADREKKIYWLRKAAENGIAVAQYEMARLYDEGKEVHKDRAVSDYWLEKSAAQGYAPANLHLEYNAELNDSMQLAAHYYLLAAQAGNEEGICRIGHQLFLDKNYQKAFYWFRRGANQNNVFCLYYLGLMWYDGSRYQIETDKERGIECLKVAKELGHTRAAEVLEIIEKVNGE